MYSVRTIFYVSAFVLIGFGCGHTLAQPVSLITAPDQHNFEQVVDVTYAIGDLPVYVGTTGVNRDSAVIACLNMDGSFLWRRAYSLGVYSVFTSVVRNDGGYMVAGISIGGSWSGTRVCLMQMAQNGDSVWTRYYGVPNLSFSSNRLMIMNEKVTVCGSVFDPTLGFPHSDGFILTTDLVGDSLDFFQYAVTDSSAYRFTGLHSDADGSVGPIGWRVRQGQERYVEAFSTELTPQLSWSSSPQYTSASGMGGISEGEWQHSDSLSLYMVSPEPDFLSSHIRHKVLEQFGSTDTQLSSVMLSDGQLRYTLGHVSYADMDMILGLTSVPIGQTQARKHFLLATDRDGTVFWSYENDTIATSNWDEVGMALDSIKGILFVAGTGHDVSGSHARIIRVDLTQIVSLMEVNEQSPQRNPLALHPNPAYEELQVTWKEASQGCVGLLQLYDADGRVVEQKSILSNMTTIDTGHLPQGIYTVTLTDCAGSVAAKQLVHLKR